MEDREPSLDQYGVVVQGGLFFTEKWEAFARYEWGAQTVRLRI